MPVKRVRARLTTLATAAVAVALLAPAPMLAQRGGAPAPTRTIEDRTAGMQKLDGYFPLYWDAAAGQLFMEISRFNTEVLNLTGLAAGLGSNDIGLDRGQGQGSRIVSFERVGPRVMMVQPNYRFRSTSSNPAEVKAVRDAFARSVLWGFTVSAESDGGRRVLVDVTEYLVRDATNMAARLSPGSYRLDNTRSAVYIPMTKNFPKNTEMEAELTFVAQAGGGGRGGRGGAFEGVGSVAATSEAASLRIHQSFVELPEPGFTPRMFDPRSGFGAFSFDDYSAPLGESITKRFIPRHRLKKQNPSAAVSDPVKPIIYYLDPGTPEPIRTALLDGARWWNQAFTAAGYRNAFRVEMLPDSVSSMDIRYNVINWVHRSTRGWSSGGSVTDPRTGEIIKGIVTLGSLRVRQDWMIFEGLLQPYTTGDEKPADIEKWSLQRIRQLSAHEVGHTLGLGHNYYNSDAGRISVLDYPQPLVTLRPNGTIDVSQAYTNEIGPWDKVSIAYGYSDFAPGTNEPQALRKILDDAWAKDLRYMTNQDLDGTPRVDQWVNGTDLPAELSRMLEVRRVALSRFGENAIKRNQPLAQIEEVLVPLYLHHRYAIDATATALGGMYYTYAQRGDGLEPVRAVPASEQSAALRALMAAMAPTALALPEPLLAKIPPRPPGYGRDRETFPRYTGPMFDAITPAVVTADAIVTGLLDADRAARMVEQKMFDATQPGLDGVIDALFAATAASASNNGYQAEIQRATERVVVDGLMSLAERASMPQVRAIATQQLARHGAQYGAASAATGAGAQAGAAHALLLASDIKRFLERPAMPATRFTTETAPPGAPIGDAAMSFLRRFEPPCSWWYDWQW